jgi:hypothetical protein
MSYAEDIIKLRKRVQDAVSKGVVATDGRDFLEASLIQIMNDAERNRQNCLTQAENLRKQAAQFDGQAGAFASVSSIVYNVINGFVMVAERDETERAAEAAEKAEAQAEEAEEKPVEKKKPGKKKA